MYHNHHLHETRHLKEANLLQEEKYRHLTTEPVGRLVCELAVPTIISMLVTAAYNLADTFFVGLMRSNAATGAVGVVFSLMAIIQATGFFFGQGSGNYISRQLGRHETEDAETMAITAVTLAFGTGLVLLILGQMPDENADEAKLAQDEAAKVDAAWQDIFGSAANQLVVK